MRINSTADQSLLSIPSEPMFLVKGCLTSRKKVLTLEVLIGILADIYKKCFKFHSEAAEIESS